MATNYKAAVAKPHFLENYKKKKKEIETLMKSWEQIQEELELIS